MPRIQGHSRVERPVPGVRRLASQDQDFSDALASKGDKPLPMGCFAPASTSADGSSQEFAKGAALPSKKNDRPGASIAALGTVDYSSNRNFTVAESPSSTNDANVNGPSSQPIGSAILPSAGQLPATGGGPGFALVGDAAPGCPDMQGIAAAQALLAGVGAGMDPPSDRSADDVVSPPDVELSSVDGSLESTATDTAAADEAITLKIDAEQSLLAGIDVNADGVPNPLDGNVISLPDAQLSPMEDGLEFTNMEDAPENYPLMQGVGAAKALFAAGAMGTGESSSQIVDGITSSLDANPPSADGNPRFSGMNDAMAGRSDLIDVENAKVPAKLPMFRNASNALLGLPIASASQSVTWSRVFGQHLIANEYLSVVDVVGGGHGESEALWASVDGHEGRLKIGGTFTSIPSAAQPDQAPDAQTVEVPRLHPAMETNTDDDNSRVVQDAPLAALENALVSDHRWNKRVLKLTHDPVGACTAWVRDFGLCESEMQTLAASLKRQATLQGVPLGRIVINGHELWRARD